MLTVHHLNNSRSQRILWLMEEIGAEYEIAHYQRNEMQRAPDEMKRVHPLGKSPVITDRGRTIAESGAIIDYILRHYGNGKLMPAMNTPAYEDYVEMLHYAEGSAVTPILLEFFLGFVPGEKGMIEYLVKEEIDKQLAYIAIKLGEREFIVGDSLTGADVQMAFVLEFARARGHLKDWPRLMKYVERMQARPAYKRALAKGGPYDLAAVGS